MKKYEEEALFAIRKALSIIPNTNNPADTSGRETHRMDLKIVNNLSVEVLNSILDEDSDISDVKNAVKDMNDFIEARVKEDWCNISNSKYSHLSWGR